MLYLNKQSLVVNSMASVMQQSMKLEVSSVGEPSNEVHWNVGGPMPK